MDQHDTEEAPLPTPEGLWLALLLDGKGGARELDWDAIQQWTPEQGALWLQLDPQNERAMEWLHEASGLSEQEYQEFLHCDRRPTLRPIGACGFVVSLIRPAPDAPDPWSGMVTIRAWIEPSRALILVNHMAPSSSQAAALLREGRGPHSIAALIAWHVATVVNQLTLEAGDLEQSIADLEFAVHEKQDYPDAIREGQARVARMLRQIAPHKAIASRALALSRDNWLLQDTLDTWQFAAEKARSSDQVLRIVQERSLTLHAYVSENLTLRMNSILLVLTIVSTVTLPVTLIAAVFNINIGIPGRSLFNLESPLAFTVALGAMVLLAGFTYVVLRGQRTFQRRVEGPQ